MEGQRRPGLWRYSSNYNIAMNDVMVLGGGGIPRAGGGGRRVRVCFSQCWDGGQWGHTHGLIESNRKSHYVWPAGVQKILKLLQSIYRKSNIEMVNEVSGRGILEPFFADALEELDVLIEERIWR